MPAFMLLLAEQATRTSPTSIIVGVTLCGLGALLLFYLGIKNLRAAGLAARIPETPIRALAPGMVKIFGKVEGEEPLTSPLTGVPCYYFAAHSESLGKRGWNGLQVAKERRKFYVNDGTSRVLVDPQGADFDVTTTLEARIGKEVGDSCKIDPSLGLPEPTPAQLRAILHADWHKPRVPVPTEELPSSEAEEKRKWWMPESIEIEGLGSIELGEGRGFRLTETCLVAGSECSVIGTCDQDRSVPNGQNADAKVIRRGAIEKTFVISCRRGSQLVRKLRRQGILFLALAAALVGFALLFWSFR